MKRTAIEYCMLFLFVVVVLPVGVILFFSTASAVRNIAHVFNFSSSNTVQLIESFQYATQTVAIIVAGIWTYYHFVKGRTFHSRLNLQLQIEPIPDVDRNFLKVSVRAANVGPSRITFSTDYSALFIIPGKTYKNHSGELKWENDSKVPLPLFTEHTFVESGEEIYEERMICMRDKAKSYKAVACFRSDDQKRTITAVTRIAPKHEYTEHRPKRRAAQSGDKGLEPSKPARGPGN